MTACLRHGLSPTICFVRLPNIVSESFIPDILWC